MEKFPCLRLAYEAAEAGGAKTLPSMPPTKSRWRHFWTADRFRRNSPSNREVLSETEAGNLESIKQVLAADAEARQRHAKESSCSGSLEGRTAGSSRNAKWIGLKSIMSGFLHCRTRRCGRDSGIMILIHEFGHYAVAKLLRCAGGAVRHRLWQAPVRLPQGRDRLPHQRVAARRLREDGGREPDGGPHRRSRASFCPIRAGSGFSSPSPARS